MLRIAIAIPLVAAAHGQQISDSAQQEIATLLAEKAARTPGQRKMASSLVHAAKVVRGEAIPAGSPIARNALSSVRLDSAKRVDVEIRATVTPELVGFIENLGGSVLSSFAEYDSIHALVPLLTVEQIATRDDVRQVHPVPPGRASRRPAPHPLSPAQQSLRNRRIATQVRQVLGDLASPAGASGRAGVVPTGTDTTGDIAHQANYVRANYGFTGAGVKIGVVSDGVDNASGQQAAGNLGMVNVLPRLAGGGDEGTALLEILYTLAPGATLYFATVGFTEAEMANSIQALADAGCNIILDDWAFLDEPIFQNGLVAKKINQLAASGIFYFSAAGNSGNVQSHASGTWQGDFVDSGPTTGFSPEIGSLNSFNGQPYDVLTITTFSFGFYELDWADPLGGSTNDYDLFILDSTGTKVIASSTNVQNGTDDPHEDFADYFGVLRTGMRVVIVKKAGASTRAMWFTTVGGILSVGTNGGVFGHAAAAGAFTVAATDVANAQGGAFTGGSADPVESYSSDGPRQMFFADNGTPITPGNFLFATNGGLVLNKPDFTAADDVPSGLPFFNPFPGTSAATPHAAAIAALVMQSNPSITLTQMRSVLTAASLRIGAAGFDSTSGSGIVMAPAAILNAAGVQVTITSAPVTSLTFTLSGSACNPGTYSTPAILTWVAGTTCQVQWASSQGSNPYTFFRWQDNSSQNPRTFTVPRVATTLTASFVQGTTLPGVPVTLNSSPAGLAYSVDGVTYSASQSFRWDANSSHTLSASSPQTLAGTLYFFKNWSNGGTESQTVTAPATATAYTISFATFTSAMPSALAHFAAGGTWTTGFLVTNTGTSPGVFSMAFFGDDGNPAALPFGSTTMSTLAGTVDAQGSAYYEAGNPQASLVGGWAQITADPSLAIQALFRNDANGTFYEAAVPSAADGSKEFLLPFDATTFAGTGQPFYTGFAVANLDAVAAVVNCTVRDPHGIVIPSAIAVPTLPPMGHWANYLFPALTGKRGTIDCASNTNVAATALRFIGANAFSSLPVTTNPATYAGAAHAAVAHFAAGNTWTTGLFVTNTGTSAAQFTIAFHDDQGNPVSLPFSTGSSNTLSSLLAAHGSAYFEASDPLSPLASGSGQITSDPSIVVQALFRDNANGTYYEAAVPSSAGSKEFAMPFDATTFAANGLPFYTGFAIANMDSTTTATIACTARDSNGLIIPSAVSVPALSPLGHWANYLFPALTGLRGTIDCTSNTNIAATALHFIGTNAFSSLQVIAK